ncbi:hypothetical protein LINGRAHAP2_LOCUS27934 [Linum grandiflorum]
MLEGNNKNIDQHNLLPMQPLICERRILVPPRLVGPLTTNGNRRCDMVVRISVSYCRSRVELIRDVAMCTWDLKRMFKNYK